MDGRETMRRTGSPLQGEDLGGRRRSDEVPAARASCSSVNPLGATTDFTEEDMLDGPSCGDAMRPEGGQPQRRQPQKGLGL